MTNRKKILVVEDHPIFKMGLCELIRREKNLFLCGTAEDVSEAIDLIESEKPELVVLDLSLKDSNGMELLRKISKYHTEIFVLVLSMHEELFHAERCLKAGAKCYLMKHETKESVIKAINHILKGKKYYISPRVNEQLLTKFISKGGKKEKKSSPAHLTDREFEIFQLIGTGLSSSQMAQRLNLSTKTISAHREQIGRAHV